ncbi:MAG: hypothetical protein PHH28_07920 [Desulfuromonadaceae bacterium]|nr:hypothetical protein [Desulfuromonadaceae bacterium]
MKTRLILKPGQKGTKRLTEKYGDSLVCVRFRYDAELRQRIKTVELIVEKTAWNPPPPRYTTETLVPLRIEGYEKALQTKTKEAGGRWNPEKQLWFVKYGNIAGTQLEKHIHVDENDNTGESHLISFYLQVDACLYI